MDEYDITPDDLSRDDFISAVIKLLNQSKNRKDQIDFSDMIYFNVIYDLPGPQYDYIFVDEFQDLTRAQIHLVLSVLKPTGRLMVLGDDLQAIYKWAGVDLDNLIRLRDKLNAKTLTLPISYRCPKVVIELAKEY